MRLLPPLPLSLKVGMTRTALTLYDYFASYYRTCFQEAYKNEARGWDLVLLARLRKKFDDFQLLRAMRAYMKDAVVADISGFSLVAEDLIQSIAYDPTECKGYIALRMKPNDALRRAYYEYVDLLDAWFPNAIDTMAARERLLSLADEVLE